MNARNLLMLCLSVVMASPVALADDSSSPVSGFSGSLLYENSVGRGTFTPGEFTSRPYWNMSLSLKANYQLPVKPKLKLTFGAVIDKNIVENADSTNTRAHQTYLYDMNLTLRWSDIVNVNKGLFSVAAWTRFFFPTSLLSQLQQKYLGARVGLNLRSKPAKWVSVSYNFRVTKNFNKYDSVVLDIDDFDFPLPSRVGGADAVGESLVATGTGITEWTVGNSASVAFFFLKKFNFAVGFSYNQYFKYKDIPLDEFSSKYASGGRGYTDLMDGSFELGYSVLDNLSLAIGSLTRQAPKTADNKDIRFPWWDTTNGAGNYQTFYFDVVGSF